jgi:hypothetical protein
MGVLSRVAIPSSKKVVEKASVFEGFPERDIHKRASVPSTGTDRPVPSHPKDLRGR